MSRIRVLPDLLVNKIAAGEVVERPASVVKELVENALDAGATRIAVTIEDGGKQLIRVTDDGEGMTADELRLAITPHATSKLAAEEDLYSIASMGFRGEALASIGAVSNLRILSRKRGVIEAHRITVSGEKIETSGAAGGPEGTAVEVRDLFFNVPARRKFLRTRATETGHVNEQFARLALGFPEVGFELTNNDRAVHKLPAEQTIRERIGSLYTAELADELIHVAREERGLTVDAYAAPPIRSRSTTGWQYVFVNGRYVRDRFVRHAAREAYRGLMEHDRQPVYFLSLTIDPQAVDVNVHPTKIEVRWRDSNLIHSQVLSAFREKFLQTDLTPALRTDTSRGHGPTRMPSGEDSDATRSRMADLLRAAEPIVGDSAPPAYGDTEPTLRPPASQHSGLSTPDSGKRQEAGGRREQHCGLSTQPSALRTQDSALRPGDGAELWRSVYADAPDPSRGLEPARSPDGAEDPSRPRAALQLHNTYLVVESEEGMLIIDQHALHERILYNEFCERITSGPLESQRLLLPETLTVTPTQMALLQENADLLHQLGIEVTPFGNDAVAVQSFPMLLKDTDAVPFIRDVLDKLEDPALQTQARGKRQEAGGHSTADSAPSTQDLGLQTQARGKRQEAGGNSTADSELSAPDSGLGTHTELMIHELLDMMACKAAVKAGDPLTPEEIEALIARKHLIEKSSSCPHGRPTTLQLSVRDLEKQFKRT